MDPHIQARHQLTSGMIQAVRYLADLINQHDSLDYRLNEATLWERTDPARVNILPNDFFYLEGGEVVGYLALFQFTPDEVEVNGMVHPDHRRRGIMTALWQAARQEIVDRRADRALFMNQRASASGQGFVDKLGATLHHSEYKMGRDTHLPTAPNGIGITLRLATEADLPELARQNACYAGGEPADHVAYQRDNIDSPTSWPYLAEVNGAIVGKIDLSMQDGQGWIYGLGILPSYRGRGYGRALLNAGIAQLQTRHPNVIMLEVELANERALGLYTSIGFKPLAIYDYYALSMAD